MSEIGYLFILPIGMSLVLIPLRKKKGLYWWLALILLLALIVSLSLFWHSRDRPWQAVAEATLLLGLPSTALFVGLRADIFRRRLYLIPLLGPLFYLAGVGAALALGVSTGVLEP